MLCLGALLAYCLAKNALLGPPLGTVKTSRTFVCSSTAESRQATESRVRGSGLMKPGVTRVGSDRIVAAPRASN